MVTRVALATALVVSCAWVGLTPANATTTVTWNFGVPTGDLGSGPTLLTATSNSAFGLFAEGWTSNLFTTSVNLWGKNNGGTEEGLGLTNDPSGNHEISGTSLIKVSFLNLISNFTFKMGSDDHHEGYSVWGFNGTSWTDVFTSSAYNDNNAHTLTGADGSFLSYYFTFYGGLTGSAGDGSNHNVLLSSISADFTVNRSIPGTPLPAALPLFASGLGALGLLGWRRKRKATAIAA